MTSPLVAPLRSPVPRRSDSVDSQVLGAVLVLAGVLLLLLRTGVISLSWQSLMSILLAALGVGMLVTVKRRNGPLLLLAGGAMTLVLVSASSIDVGVVNAGVGERTIVATTVDQARQASTLGIGHVVADLRDLEVPAGTTELTYEIGVGQLEVILPADTDIAVQVMGSVKVGEIDALGRTGRSGESQRLVTDRGFADAERRIVLRVSVGVGNVQVTRPPAAAG